MGVEKVQYRVCDLLLFSLAEGKDHAVENKFPLKQEGSEATQAQGEGAGKHLFGRRCYWFIVMVLTYFQVGLKLSFF